MTRCARILTLVLVLTLGLGRGMALGQGVAPGQSVTLEQGVAPGQGVALGQCVAPGQGVTLGQVTRPLDAAAQENGENLCSEAGNVPAAQENGKNLRSAAENVSQAHEIAEILRSEAENVPAAQENGENLRSEAENVPAAQENGENLRSEAENGPAAHEIAENLRSGAENGPAAHEIAENLRSEAENVPAAHEIAENLRSEAEIVSQAHEIAENLRSDAENGPAPQILPTAVSHAGTRHGPTKGHLIIIGGGPIPDEIWDTFVRYAGGPAARIVVITNASGSEEAYQGPALEALGNRVPEGRVTRLHLRDTDEANDPALIAPLAEADGVFFTGGRQWRIAEVYLNTRAHRALNALLERGGVIGGTSAGASIQGSFLWRGDTRGPQITVGDHTQGFGFMKCTVIDQHLFARQREADLLPFIEAAPAYVGIGIDESTAVLVERDSIRVAGLSKVALYLPGRETPLLLQAGEGYDLGSVSHVVAAGESFDFGSEAHAVAAGESFDFGSEAHAVAAGESLGLGSTSHSPAAGESDASAQENGENPRSEAENGPAAHEIAENLRSEAENVTKAQENGENLRSKAENVPAAQENGKNLRSEAENGPAAQENGKNLRSEAENVPAAQENGENLRKSPQAAPSAARTQTPPSAARPQTPSLDPPVLSRAEKGELSRAEKGELSRTEKGELSRAEKGELSRAEKGELSRAEKGEFHLSEEDTEKVLKAIEGQLIDPPLHALRLESEEFRWQQLIVPGTLLAAGAIGTYSTWYRDHINIPVRDRMSEWTGGRQFHFDDYIQYLPGAASLGLGFVVPSEHGFAERLCVTATAYATMGLLANTMKYTLHVPRPDSDARNSFPSGHTCMAFTGAEIVRREYGPWWGAGAYAIATTTALMRVYNGRHWTSDIIGGAAIGILSADIGYWLLPLERRLFHIAPGSGKSFTVLPTSYGLSLSCVF